MIRKTAPADRAGSNGDPTRLRQRLDGYYAALARQLTSAGARRGEGGRAVGVTSCRRGEGVSTVAANLAVEAAGPGARRTLLIDANSGDPAVARAFELDDSPGLPELLAGRAKEDGCIRPSSIDRLSIVTAGSSNGLAAFDIQAAEDRLSDLRRKFDFIVMDLPPAAEWSICLPLAGMLDGVLLVIEAERVPAEAVFRAKEQLRRAGANLLGAVFNKTNESQ